MRKLDTNKVNETYVNIKIELQALFYFQEHEMAIKWCNYELFTQIIGTSSKNW